jgi:hypothetical protein
MLGHFYESFKIARVGVLALLPVPIPIIPVKIMKRGKQRGGFRHFLKDRESWKVAMIQKRCIP